MRYLFGDSVPFPQQYNFLSTLEAFVACATATLKLDGEIAKMRAKIATEAETRMKAVSSLEIFHQGLVRFLGEGLKRTSEPLISEYSRQLQEVATHGVEGARKAATEANERDEVSARGDIDRKRAEVRGALDTFLKAASFPSLHYSVTLRLDGNVNKVNAILTLPQGITAGFNLGTSQVREWTVPRRVAEFAQGLVLKIGLKKGWMKKSVELEPISIDDLIVSAFELEETTAEIRLKRKLDQDDAFVFRIKTAEGKGFAEVLRPLDEGADAHPSPLEDDDRKQIERLWQAMRAATTQLLPHRENLTAVALDGQDLFEHDRIVPFVERVVEMLAPVLAEVDRRSPNPEELSLKVENERGRREEIYVRKGDLIAKLESLPAESRAVLDRLGLTGAETLTATDVTVEVG
ncbi:MAG: hypothetical protein HY898_01460 [Deltaproteobacteria bacterium]|nr:hypothetical protein [Deltaproteobacteria bacterium]